MKRSTHGGQPRERATGGRLSWEHAEGSFGAAGLNGVGADAEAALGREPCDRHGNLGGTTKASSFVLSGRKGFLFCILLPSKKEYALIIRAYS